jgi:hypothetical protein
VFVCDALAMPGKGSGCLLPRLLIGFYGIGSLQGKKDSGLTGCVVLRPGGMKPLRKARFFVQQRPVPRDAPEAVHSPGRLAGHGEEVTQNDADERCLCAVYSAMTLIPGGSLTQPVGGDHLECGGSPLLFFAGCLLPALEASNTSGESPLVKKPASRWHRRLQPDQQAGQKTKQRRARR